MGRITGILVILLLTALGSVAHAAVRVEPAVLDLFSGDDSILERKPLETLAADGELMAYAHDGFWQPMDTMRDRQLLEELWATGNAPWKIWT